MNPQVLKQVYNTLELTVDFFFNYWKIVLFKAILITIMSIAIG